MDEESNGVFFPENMHFITQPLYPLGQFLKSEDVESLYHTSMYDNDKYLLSIILSFRIRMIALVLRDQE